MLVRDLDLKPGDMLLLRIKGFMGFLVWLMQAINFDLSRWTHVAVVLDDHTVFEAQPGGAVITSLEKYANRQARVVSMYKVFDRRFPLELSDEQREAIVRWARELYREGVRYGWGTYLYLALYRLHIRWPWLKRRVQKSTAMICSQAADYVYRLSGVKLFDDGRMPCDLTPGDLAKLS